MFELVKVGNIAAVVVSGACLFDLGRGPACYSEDQLRDPTDYRTLKFYSPTEVRLFRDQAIAEAVQNEKPLEELASVVSPIASSSQLEQIQPTHLPRGFSQRLLEVIENSTADADRALALKILCAGAKTGQREALDALRSLTCSGIIAATILAEVVLFNALPVDH